jgi:S1-C subfamily serine protease
MHDPIRKCLAVALFLTACVAGTDSFGTPPEQRAVLGINIASDPNGTGPVEGVVVVGVTPGGPADRAGLRADDVIVSINEQSLTADSATQANRRLLRFMDGVAPGDELSVAYLRAGDARSASLEAGALDPDTMPPEFSFIEPLERFGEQFEHHVLRPFASRWRYPGIFAGMELVALTPELGRYFGTEEGMLVVRAPTEDTIPLEDGDVIQKIGGRRPRDPAHAMRIFRSYEPGEELVLNIVRDQRKREIEITMPDEPEPRLPGGGQSG